MSKAIVRKSAKLNNNLYYYDTASVTINPKDNYKKHYSKIQYPYIDFRSDTYVNVPAPIETENVLWKNTASVLSGYELNGFDVASTLEFLRLNSNIYKNIVPEIVSDMEYINKIIDNIPTSTASIHQDNHNLQIGDAVYLDDDKLYKKALAENSNKSNVVGIVSKVNSPNVFTLMNTGKIDYQHLDYTDTSILYLSDKIPGKLVHYSNISNTVYVPVAIYAGNQIIVNIQQGSVGDTLAPYEQEITNFETYNKQDLDDIINQTIGGVLNA